MYVGIHIDRGHVIVRGYIECLIVAVPVFGDGSSRAVGGGRLCHCSVARSHAFDAEWCEYFTLL